VPGPLARNDRESRLVDYGDNLWKMKHAVIASDQALGTGLFHSKDHPPVLLIAKELRFDVLQRAKVYLRHPLPQGGA
jgi:hypothetical protein